MRQTEMMIVKQNSTTMILVMAVKKKCFRIVRTIHFCSSCIQSIPLKPWLPKMHILDGSSFALHHPKELFGFLECMRTDAASSLTKSMFQLVLLAQGLLLCVLGKSPWSRPELQVVQNTGNVQKPWIV
jgi:hypothetical protein